jgi:hypothetical protein
MFEFIKRTKTAKFIYLTFIFVLLILLGELGYYFWRTGRSKTLIPPPPPKSR